LTDDLRDLVKKAVRRAKARAIRAGETDPSRIGAKMRRAAKRVLEEGDPDAIGDGDDSHAG
jgi:hypothetical protein